MCNLDNVVNRKRIGYMIAMKIPPVPQLRWSLSKTRHLDRLAWDLGLAQSFRSIRAYLTACQRQSAIQIIARTHIRYYFRLVSRSPCEQKAGGTSIEKGVIVGNLLVFSPSMSEISIIRGLLRFESKSNNFFCSGK